MDVIDLDDWDEQSPMPFGCESVEDTEELATELADSWSPMPFGCESVEDLGRRRETRFGIAGHQCLSAVSPLRTTRLHCNHLR